MNISALKKTASWGLALAMMLSLTACGDKGGNKSADSSGKDYGDVKNMVYAGEEMDLSGVKGDPNTFVISGDKIYFLTSEWPDMPEGEMTDSGEPEQEAAAEDEADNAEAETADDNTGDDQAETTDKDAAKEETSEEGDTAKSEEAGSSEETTEDESDTAEDSSTSEEVDDEAEEAVDESDIENNSITRVYSMNLDATGITEICEPVMDNKQEYIQYLVLDKDSKMMLFSATYDPKTESQQYYLSKLDESGKVSDHQDITKALGLGQDSYITKVITDDKGNIIVITDQSVFIMDSSYNKVAEVKNENDWIEGAAKTKDGDIICASTGEEGVAVQVLDVAGKKFGEKIKLDLQYFGGSDSLMDGRGDYDFFYKDAEGIFAYSIADKKTTKLMDYLASEINANNTYGIIPIDNETMVGSSWDDNGAVLTLYKKVDPSEVKDKTTIMFGSLWGVGDDIRNAAIKFNKENDKYRIEFMDYSDAEDAITKMNADIVAGNVPDIIDLSNLSVEQYVSKGIMEDLTPYFEKDDVVKKDDILPSVEKAMEIDGKLYYISPNFGLQSLIASKKDVGDKTGWTFEELKALLDEKGDDVRPFYSENKSDTMYSFLHACASDFVDWSTGKCSFDSDDFKAILEIANRGTDTEMDYDEDSPSQPSLIKSGKILFSDGWIDCESVQTYKKMYNSDITFIGYPCSDKQGSYFNFDTKVGIYSKSSVKEGAWEFIRTLMTKDFQASSGYMNNNPTNKDAFEAFMKSKTATKEYKDEYGNEIYPLDSSWGWGDVEFKIGPLSAEEEQMYRDLINNTTKVTTTNDEVMNIITEEAANYFNGQKSLDETADIIQNRVTTYVNENR